VVISKLPILTRVGHMRGRRIAALGCQLSARRPPPLRAAS
jgi:hypothetical protein